MYNFEKYLLSLGFFPYRRYSKDKSLTLIDESKCSFFSSIQDGCMYNILIKDNIEIYYGLSEKDKQPTLISPRPIGCFSDDSINRTLQDNTPEEFFNLIFNKNDKGDYELKHPDWIKDIRIDLSKYSLKNKSIWKMDREEVLELIINN